MSRYVFAITILSNLGKKAAPGALPARNATAYKTFRLCKSKLIILQKLLVDHFVNILISNNRYTYICIYSY